MSSKTYRFLSANQVKRIYALAISNSVPTQPTLLESAVQSPMTTKYYEKQEDIYVLAGILSTKIMKNHAFSDGNKRLALLSADMFLKINGYQLQAEPLAPGDPNKKALEEAHVKVVKDEMTAEELGKLYASIATSTSSWSDVVLAYRNGATEY
ncbi:DOC family protein [Corynespora cassiicola Philippines]|uniref:DOC family protein n=1 Tax=Corynespora cassiicola Philippines TaxID=1448308 RepID=A0A2T2N6P9_CORCC|nr:DOC family protein [Corynespora cassiicola Philippines]